MNQLLSLVRSAGTSESARRALGCLLRCVLHGVAASAGADRGRGPRLSESDRDRTGQ
jgi:hypothetical protein